MKAFGAPDAGPWELRGTEAAHTFSAVMSWAGCDRLAEIAARIGKDKEASRWGEQAATMHARILAEAWNPQLGSFVSTFGGDALDATSLLIAELRFLPATDERFVGTVAAIGRRLRSGDLLFRYRHADDFGGTDDHLYGLCILVRECARGRGPACRGTRTVRPAAQPPQ